LLEKFPYVAIPSTDTVESMRRDRPFLLLAVLASSTFDRFATQKALSEEIKQIVNVRIVAQGEKSLDLLEGLIVHIAW
jgi:hypothetical protein